MAVHSKTLLRSKMWRRISAAYTSALVHRPITTNGLQGATLGAAGDVLAQAIEESPSMSTSRAVRAAAIGGFWSAVLVPAVYRLLDGTWPGTSGRAVVFKSLADIALLGTFGNAASMGLRGTSSTDVCAAMPGVLVNEMRVWLPYNLFAFSLIPAHIRPTTTVLLTFGWSTYISHTAHNSHDSDQGLKGHT